MTEDKLDTGRSLAELSASEYLLFNSDMYKLTTQSSPDASSGRFNLSPKYNYLPPARLQVDAGPDKSPSADFSVGTELLNFQSRFEYPPQGGSVVKNTLSGKAGPFGAFYSETDQPGNQGLEQTSLGGSLAVGPVQLYGQRNQSSQNVVDPSYAPFFQNPRQDTETDTFGARGSLPFMGGTLFGDISRQYGTARAPQHISQDARPTGQAPNITNYQAKWRGKAGPGILSLQGGLKDVRNVGMEPSAKAEYIYDNPLGLGGKFSATGSYVNPLDPNLKSDAMAGVRYTIPLGGRR